MVDIDVKINSHAAHHLLAIYAMGAPKKLLEAAYETHVVYQKPSFPPPEEPDILLRKAQAKVEEDIAKVIIDEKNWKDYLGDERYAFVQALVLDTTTDNGIRRYYQAYVAFFTRLLQIGRAHV